MQVYAFPHYDMDRGSLIDQVFGWLHRPVLIKITQAKLHP